MPEKKLLAKSYYDKELIEALDKLHIPHCQSQQSLNDQLDILRRIANRLGLYDAADFLKDALT